MKPGRKKVCKPMIVMNLEARLGIMTYRIEHVKQSVEDWKPNAILIIPLTQEIHQMLAARSCAYILRVLRSDNLKKQ